MKHERRDMTRAEAMDLAPYRRWVYWSRFCLALPFGLLLLNAFFLGGDTRWWLLGRLAAGVVFTSVALVSAERILLPVRSAERRQRRAAGVRRGLHFAGLTAYAVAVLYLGWIGVEQLRGGAHYDFTSDGVILCYELLALGFVLSDLSGLTVLRGKSMKSIERA